MEYLLIFIIYHYIYILFIKKLKFKRGDFPISENYSENAISIPVFPDLNYKKQMKVINIIVKFLKNEKNKNILVGGTS